jgi:hypothetical protein
VNSIINESVVSILNELIPNELIPNELILNELILNELILNDLISVDYRFGFEFKLVFRLGHALDQLVSNSVLHPLGRRIVIT